MMAWIYSAARGKVNPVQKRGAAKPKSAPESDAEPAISFEEALANLEKIIDRIESGKVGLEESIGEYERGVAMLKRCRAILDRAEQRVAELTSAPGDERGR